MNIRDLSPEELASYSEYAQKTIVYAIAKHAERPDFTPAQCVSSGAVQMCESYGWGREYLIHIALEEIVAKWLFPDERAAVAA